MANESPPRRPAPRRSITIEEPAPEYTKYLPYAGVAAVVLGLVAFITKSETYSVHAATVLTVGVILGLGYAGVSHSQSLPPRDSLRTFVNGVTAVVCLAALAPLLFSLFPPRPQGRLLFDHQGQSTTVDLHGAVNTVVLIASGDFKPDMGPQVNANYDVLVSRDGAEEDNRGTFTRSTTETSLRRGVHGGGGVSETRANRHVLQGMRGAGRYTVTLYRMADTLAAPFRVDVIAEPFSQFMLAVLFGLLALGIVAVDVALYRRGTEPAYAAAMLLPLAAVFYFHGHMTRATLPTDLLAAGIVGVLGGGLGGELLARLGRMIAAK